MFLNPVTCALALGVPLLFSVGCAGSLQSAGTVPQAHWSSEQGADRGTSWVLPEAKQHTLLYLSTALSGVYVFDYPTRRLVGVLTEANSPQGLCSDAAGDVFISDMSGQVLEYAHGGKSPIRRLVGGAPLDCAVDPKNGNLAVTSDGDSQIFIFIKAKGQPKLINDPNAHFIFCAYDSRGNLFAGNYSSYYYRSTWYYQALISELPRGASTFKNFKFNKNITGSGGPLGIQSHDGYLTVGNEIDNNVYQVRISKSIAKVVSKTPLVGTTATRQFTFYHDKLISPDPLSDFAGIWSYPAGGKPVHEVEGLSGEPLGSTISEP